MSPLDLAPFARAGLRRARVTQLAVAAILGGLGALVVAILTAVTLAGAARPEDQVPLIAGITAVVTMLPALLLLRMGLPHESRHVLVRVLEQHPEKVRRVTFSYAQTARGHVRIAHVELTEGTHWNVEVPAEEQLARAPRRAPRTGQAMTTFSGDFVPLHDARADAWAGLEGQGTIEVTDAALVVHGARARSGLATVVAVILSGLAGFASIVFFAYGSFSWIDDPRLPAIVAIVLTLALHVGIKQLLVRALPRARVTLALPWLTVQAVRLAGPFVEVQTIHPELVGLSRFRTDRAQNLVAQCGLA